nr:anti-sigma factor [Paenibacillus xylanexedens]
MKCEEVVEWMHRYLDHDLGEAETTQMLQHVAKCPECAENFSMLRALSRELEDLPKVSPRFSLVDAIMPQLDAIDEARKEQSSTVQEMSPVPAAFENLQRSSSGERKAKTKWFNSMAGRMSMGAAAAAVVLGFAIFGYKPEQIENADSMMMKSEASQESNAGQSALSMEVNNDQGSSPSQEEGGVTAPDSNDSLQERSEQPQADQPETGTETQAPDHQADQKPVEPSTRGAAAPDQGKQESSPSVDAAPSQKNEKPNQGLDQKQPGTNAGNGADSNATDQKSMPEQNDQADDTFSAQTIVPNEDAPARGITSNDSGAGEDAAGGQQSQGLTAPDPGNTGPDATTAKEWKSPDGAYVVMLIGDQLSVYAKSANDPDVLNLIEQRNIEGTLKSASWSQDGKQFSYETDKDGTITKNSFKPNAASETPPAK